MAKAIIVLAVIATAYSAVIKNQDLQLQRITRSPCSTCGPPPPPLLRTQNWSGLARSSDGLQNTVFSGAAAAADQGPLAAGEAFSLASSSAGAGFDKSANSGTGSSNGAGIKGHYGKASGVQGSFSAHGGKHKVYGGGFQESHNSYHSVDRKDFGVQEGLQQNGQTAASSSSSSAAQGGSFGNSNKDVAFGGSDGGHSGANTYRGDGDVQETQQQDNLSGHRKNDHFEGYGTSQQKYQESGRVENLGSGSSSGQIPSNGGSTDADFSHLQYGSSKHQEKEESSFKGNTGGNGHGRFDSDISSGQETKQENLFGGAAGQGSFGSQSSSHDEGRRREFGSHRGGSHKHGFEASKAQSSSNGQAGFGSGQYQESSGNQGQLQVSGSGGFGQGGYGSESAISGQQGYSRRSGSADAHSALSGALNLASQGLQTTGQADCSTCSKSSYALSNAKSRSGSAVAVSIGG